MIKDLFKNYIYPMSVFAGSMVGVGFLSLPYIASRSGIFVTSLYFLVLTFVVAVVDIIFCEISLKTPDFKRFPGFVEHYLGKWPKVLAMALMIFSGFGVLLVYLLVGSQFLATIFQPLISINNLYYVLIYFILASLVIFFDIKLVSKVEFWIMGFLFLSLVLVFITGFNYINPENIFSASSIGWVSNLFLPYGPLLFALWGVGIIPEIEEMMIKDKKRLKKTVILTTVIVSVFYFLFTLLVLSITGPETDQMALPGLQKFLGSKIAIICLLMGTAVTFAAFVTQGIVFKKSLMYDLKIRKRDAFIITCFTPFILFLLGFKSFISSIELIGGLVFGINGLLILLMYKKIGGKKIVIYPLALIFILGAAYEIFNFLNK
jgi:amino acid permease